MTSSCKYYEESGTWSVGLLLVPVTAFGLELLGDVNGGFTRSSRSLSVVELWGEMIHHPALGRLAHGQPGIGTTDGCWQYELQSPRCECRNRS